MRKIFGFLLIVGLLFLSFPFLAGFIAHARFVQSMEVFSGITGMRVSTVSYDRSWFSTVATSKVEITDPSLLRMYETYRGELAGVSGKPITLIVKHKFLHGPFVYDNARPSNDRWQVAQTVAYSTIVLPGLDGADQEFSRARTVIHMNGSGSTLLESLALEVKDKNTGDGMAWSGLKSQWDFAPNFIDIKGELMIPGFAIKRGGNYFQVQEGGIAIDRHRGAGNLWEGHMKTKIGKLVLGEQGAQPIEIKQLTIDKHANIEDKKVSINYDVDLGSLKLERWQFGKGKMNLKIDNVDVKTMSHYYSLSRDIDDGKFSSAHLELIDKIIDLLPDLLKRRPEVNVKIENLMLPEGPINAKAYLAVGGKKVKKLASPLHIVEMLEGNMDVRLPKRAVVRALQARIHHRIMLENEATPLSQEAFKEAMLVETEKELHHLMAQNLIKQEGANYVIKATYKDQKLLLNGKEISWRMLAY